MSDEEIMNRLDSFLEELGIKIVTDIGRDVIILRKDGKWVGML